MKKLFLLVFAALFAIASTQAQDAKKELSNAKKALGSYNLDPTNNRAKLHEAKKAIDIASEDAVVGATTEVWIKRGDIYNEIATQQITVRQLGFGKLEDLPSVNGNPAVIASESYRKAAELALKKFEKKDAAKGLRAAQGNLNSLGFYDYEEQRFEQAMQAFEEAIFAHEVLKANDEESTLNKEDDYNNQLYITGLAALNAGKPGNAKPYFQKLIDLQFDKPAIYEALYQVVADETSPQEAYPILEKGRMKYPEDISLLFADINHYLKLNALDQLIGKLQTAIQQEPNNLSLYTTTGSVYDNLYQREFEAGNSAKADEYFAKALEYFEMALKKEPNNFDAIYSVGALYYNKAATMTKELNALQDDYSKEGLRKYEAKRKEIFDQFEFALPYFKRCEKLNPNDLNTLIALKEIYARKDDLETSNEFKQRLENVQAGGKNAKSYFND
ncbi:MAG TPA: hypothetical protein PKD70_13360 [Saprospiraceae bacterium]|nr:hypothetical protein [Saprospiraceae bacterium]HMP14861.1 hypothetical protein [Saprospiraceae bacterium]